LYPLLKENVTSKAVVEIAKLYASYAADEEPLKEEDVIIDFSRIHSGRGNENPMNFVMFYGKYERNGSFSNES
jgi:hypothetical protein